MAASVHLLNGADGRPDEPPLHTASPRTTASLKARTEPPAGPSGVPALGLALYSATPSISPVPRHMDDAAETHKAELRRHATRRIRRGFDRAA